MIISNILKIQGLFIVFGLLNPCLNAAFTEDYQEIRAKALQHYQNQEWDKALQAFSSMTDIRPDEGEGWFYQGAIYYKQSDYTAAARAYHTADSLRYSPARTQYNLACLYSLQEMTEEALKYLSAAINSGFRQPELLLADNDLANIRNDPRFQELVMQLEGQVYPCLHNPKYSEFDLWLGDWVVFNQDGQKVGENSIQKIMKGCLIFENWTSVRGSQGKSFNYYDPKSGKWKQNWVDENGRIIRYIGKIKNGAMNFQGELIQPDGKTEIARVIIQPMPDGTLHHLIEHSIDMGKNWYVWFNGIYKRKK